jgi:hypothetical protein
MPHTKVGSMIRRTEAHTPLKDVTSLRNDVGNLSEIHKNTINTNLLRATGITTAVWAEEMVEMAEMVGTAVMVVMVETAETAVS